MTRPTIQTQTEESESQYINEPIHESLVLFVFKISAILLVTNLVYMSLNFFLLQAFFLNHALPFNLHNETAYILTFLHLATTAAQVWGISTVVTRWLGRTYYVTSKHLVLREGIMNCVEKLYDLGIIRSISVQQSWLGKIFRFGTVSINFSASGGYTDQATLFGISDPQQYEQVLRR